MGRPARARTNEYGDEIAYQTLIEPVPIEDLVSTKYPSLHFLDPAFVNRFTWCQELEDIVHASLSSHSPQDR